MLDSSVSLLLLLGVLAGFIAVGVRAARPARGDDVDDYVLARNSQGPMSLGLSFLASGLGAWILFAPPELGAIMGLDAVVGYAAAAAGPFVVFAVVGPRLRRAVPSGHGLNEFLRVRFGPAAGMAVALLSLGYMGVFVAAELVAVGGVVQILGGVPPTVTVPAVVAATLAYTTYGGLRASLRTDRWQGWLVIALLVIAGTSALTSVTDPVGAVRASGLLGVDRAGMESAATLIIAVTAANLFHQGYWQRVWAAADDRALRRGALIGAAVTMPLLLVTGGLGVLAASVGAGEVPALSVFALAGEFPTAVVAGVLVLGVALVASSVDTIENALAGLLVAERPRMRLGHARGVTVAIMGPAAVVGLVADSVLQLFLIADLLCAALVGPALMGLWRRTTTAGVLTGAIAGLLGALAGGWLPDGTLSGTVAAVAFPDAVPTLPPFLGALVGGVVGTVVASLTVGRAPTMTGLDDAVRDRAAPQGAGVA